MFQIMCLYLIFTTHPVVCILIFGLGEIFFYTKTELIYKQHTLHQLKTILALNDNSEKRKLCLTINNDSKDIANGFNNFFVSIGPELAKGIHSDINPLAYVNNISDSIAIFNVSCEEVRNIIHSLKNSRAGHDEFPTFVGKLCVDSYIEPLTFLINSSLKTGVFPSVARVVPIFKAVIQAL